MCTPIAAPNLPLAKVYAVIPEGETPDYKLIKTCLDRFGDSYCLGPDSEIGVVSINGTSIESGFFVSTLDWNIRVAYPSTSNVRVSTLSSTGFFLPEENNDLCLYDASLFGWEAEKWFRFLQSARTGRDLETYLNDKYAGPLPIPR